MSEGAKDGWDASFLEAKDSTLSTPSQCKKYLNKDLGKTVALLRGA